MMKSYEIKYIAGSLSQEYCVNCVIRSMDSDFFYVAARKEGRKYVSLPEVKYIIL